MGSRRATSTSNFGVSRRENHDASAFYQRFHSPEVSADSTVLDPVAIVEPFQLGDARQMDAVPDGSVALVVTSPPYFAGKTYEEELEAQGVPSSYLEYLGMLTEVFAECVRTLEPGGRIAVNVANLGRKPYRSLSADVIGILQDDLGLLLRGEVIWQKSEGASGSCAWGSFRSPANPVLRDITERIVVASKGRFDRALSADQRRARGLPNRSTVDTEDFMALTLDRWLVPPESARRVGHPAPFPVELPEQLIRLYTYENDLVLDPFMGSGSTLVAADLTGRRYVGYDMDPTYVDLSRTRVAQARSDAAATVRPDTSGMAANKLADEVLAAAGFDLAGAQRDRRVARSGVAVGVSVTDAAGGPWFVEIAGPATSHRGGLSRTHVVWKQLGRATALRAQAPDVPLVVLTTAVPKARSEGDVALRAAGPALLFDVIDMGSSDARERLRAYAAGGRVPLPGFWSRGDIDERFDPPHGRP